MQAYNAQIISKQFHAMKFLKKLYEQGSYPLCGSQFPDYSLTFPWMVVKNTQFFPDPHFTCLQKEC